LDSRSKDLWNDGVKGCWYFTAGMTEMMNCWSYTAGMTS
jgi:hypothetical protein